MYVQSNTLLLLMYLRTFEICLKIYELDPTKFLSIPVLAWQAASKKTKLKLHLLTNIDMVLMVEKGRRGGICHSIYKYEKASNRNMKDDAKNKELLYVQDWDVNNL